MKLHEHRNSKMQGNAGLGAAIAHFTECGCTISIPLNDSQDYDLIIDSAGFLNKIQVKTTTFKNGETYVALLCSCNLKGKTAFDNTKVNFVFILTGDGSKYLIPATAIKAKNTISLGAKYKKFKLNAC
jgi:hypothetical protein